MRGRTLTLLAVLAIFIVAVAGNYSELFTKDAKKIRATGKEDHSITLEEASAMTSRYQANLKPGALKGGYFGEDAIFAILNQEDVVGLRFYFGLNEDGTRSMVLVGVNPEGDDVVDGLLAERNSWCPPFCSKENVLNTPKIQFSNNF